MAAPVQDVLSGADAPEEGTRPSRALVAALALAAVLAAALVGVLERDPEQQQVPVAVEVAGLLIFDGFSAEPVEQLTGQVEQRDETARGVVRLELLDGELRGGARLAYDASITLADPHYAMHLWGDVTLHFGTDFCEGTIAWSNAEPPLEGGGALQVRCDDGATIGGRLAATPQPERDLVMDLRDGWYRAGAEGG